jgi:hypothetical protein
MEGTQSKMILALLNNDMSRCVVESITELLSEDLL